MLFSGKIGAIDNHTFEPLTTTTAGIATPTIREEDEVQMGPQTTAESIQKHPRVMGPESVAVPIGSA
jgi:hypothetical protein